MYDPLIIILKYVLSMKINDINLKFTCNDAVTIITNFALMVA